LYSRRAALGGIGALSAAMLGSVTTTAAAHADPLPPLSYGIDVRREGAVGDGTTDDTAAVQRALDRAASGGSHLVVVPPGTYRITQPLAATAPIHVVGLGGEAGSVLNFEGNLASGLTITQASTEEPYPGPPIEVSGLTFEYGGPGAALFTSEDGVRAPFQDTRIAGCRFYVRGSATALSSLNQRSLVVTECQFLGSGHSTGIAVNDSDNTTIVQNVFYHMQYGIHGIRGAVRVYNAGCVVMGNSMSGFEKALYFENWESVQIVGNMLDGASRQCVHLVDCYRGSLSGNYLGPTGTDSALLIETSTPRGGLGQLMFQGNYINHYAGNEGQAAIGVIGASPELPVDQVTISANIINGYPALGAIHLKNAQNVLITGNTMNRASASAAGVTAIYDETPGANHIVHNVVDADIVADGDTVADNFVRVAVPS
jgi:hypothetical protein